MAELKLSIDGMSCQHCVGRVKQALTGLKGVKDADVQVGSASVNYDEAALKPADIEAAVTKVGYKIKK